MARAEAAAASFWAPSIQAKAQATVAGSAVAIGALGGRKAYSVAATGWQVSMVTVVVAWVTTESATRAPAAVARPPVLSAPLAAPQQSPVAQVVSPLAGLRVPLDGAFSHLAPAAPAAGLLASAASTRVSMVAMAAVLADLAVSRAAAYWSNLASLHATIAARWAAFALSRVT